MHTSELAQLHSATSFLNSFLLEWPHQVDESKNEILIEVNKSVFIVKLKNYSLLGRHHYTGHFEVRETTNSHKVGFLEFARILVQELGVMLKTEQKDLTQFVSRIINSNENINLTIDKRKEELENLGNNPLDFKTAEQSMFVGHTFHPTPKSRSEFSADDFAKYSPEMASSFPLDFLLVDQDLVFERRSHCFDQPDWLKNLYLKNNDTSIPEGFVPYPVHPWQKGHILKNKEIQKYIDLGRIKEVKGPSTLWHPTSSLRTLYSKESKFMLKFSMNLKLTNSMRTLLVHELERGLQVHEVFTHENAQAFIKANPQFDVIYEPVYAGIKDEAGNPIQESLIVGRYNPIEENEAAIVLSTLTQDDLNFKENLIQKNIHAYSQACHISFSEASIVWFKAFLKAAIAPLIDAQANYGILLGSHQQNMVIGLTDHLPTHSYFRDCNGTGYNELGQKLFGDIPRLTIENGNILHQETVSFLFGYYVIINSVFNTISAISYNNEISEKTLLKELWIFLTDIKNSNPKDPSFVNYLLDEQNLMHKGNFLCSLKNINENTQKNPLSIYTQIKNPIHKARFQ